MSSSDRSAWTLQGPRLQKHISNSDLIQTVESGKAAIFADLDGDADPDLLLRNGGGYDSRSPTASNLRVRLPDGRTPVVPPHSYHYGVPTNFEPGATRVFMNRYDLGRRLRVRLIDTTPGTWNRDAIGARIVLNGESLEVVRVGDGSFVSNRVQAPVFGLGEGSGTHLTVRWPDRSRTLTEHPLDGLANGTVTLRRSGATVAVEFIPFTPETQ